MAKIRGVESNCHPRANKKRAIELFQNADWIFITFEKVQKGSLGGIGGQENLIPHTDSQEQAPPKTECTAL